MMASIREKKQNGKVISYQFTCCLGRDGQGKQIRRYGYWTPPQEIEIYVTISIPIYAYYLGEITFPHHLASEADSSKFVLLAKVQNL